ncbi:hypothetical protein ACLOJK_030951 [Asimina triloba]
MDDVIEGRIGRSRRVVETCRPYPNCRRCFIITTAVGAKERESPFLPDKERLYLRSDCVCENKC